jgi:pimeloyl-ACP methyl ester carboxylesterase
MSEPRVLAEQPSTVLLLHAGIADSQMWRPQIEALVTAGYRVLAPDLRGFGQRALEPVPFSHLRDLEVLLDGPAAVVGNSLGGRVALELSLYRPELVERLVVIAPGLPGWEWSAETRAGWAEEETAYESGEVEAAAEASVRMWVDGPRRTPEEVDSTIRSDVRAMVLRSYEMQRDGWEAGAREEVLLDPPVNTRLAEIDCPTLVIVGEEDVADMRSLAAHIADAVSGARLVEVSGAAHLPSLERPDEINELLLAFLAHA